MACRRELPELVALMGAADAEGITAAKHMPSHVAARLASLLREARDGGLDGFAFLSSTRSARA